MRTIIRLQRRCNIPGTPLQLSIQTSILQYKAALLQYRQFRNTATKARSTWQESIISQHLSHGDTEAANSIRTLQKRENQRALHRRINNSVRGERNAGVTCTIAPSATTQGVQEYHRQADVERENIKYMSTLFHCADNTPLRQPPLLDDLGYMGNTTAGDAITNGEY